MFLVLGVVIAVMTLASMIQFTPRGTTVPAAKLAEEGSWWALTPWLLYFGVVVLLIRWMTQRSARLQLRRFGPLQRPRTFEFSESVVVITEPLAGHNYYWSAFTRWVETPAVFSLYVSETGMEIVTKRDLAGPAEIERLREMMRRKIQPPATVRPAFPVLQAGAT
jgi:hypothetical protein